ncbi:MAG: N-acetylmuramoyl-L-alanine amidase [Prevotella sp.]|jgi:N-acetylmuramoyl-L-alanine amidase|nr:N-acetylmuramoyl-L-alanine amidase [Prevotella sp.]
MKQYILYLLFIILSISVFAQSRKDTPREGEGVYAFLRRNKCTETEQYNRFLELNKGKLGKNNALKKGVAYILPDASPKSKNSRSKDKPDAKAKPDKESAQSAGAKRTYKLFGKKYEDYTIKSDKLKGATFFLSGGHGGPDPGATAKVDGHMLHEDEYAYDITLRLARCLMEEGATVHMIIQDAKDGIRDDRYLANSNRETCMGQAIPLNQVKRLKQRSEKINSLSKQSKDKYKRAVFIHLDSRSNKQRLDVFFYHAKNSAEGKKLAKTIRDTFDDHYNTHQPNRGFTGTVSTRNLYVLDNTAPIGLFAELGNIQNTFDQRRFLDPDNRQALANWMCRGYIKDYENRKAGKK